jgi:starvation-inducible outer membrane lipoprotein
MQVLALSKLSGCLALPFSIKKTKKKKLKTIKNPLPQNNENKL